VQLDPGLAESFQIAATTAVETYEAAGELRGPVSCASGTGCDRRHRSGGVDEDRIADRERRLFSLPGASRE
jgi:hypothetical protein